jgi:cysteine synthase A
MKYCEERPGTALFLNQHGNPDNGCAHETTTGPEIWEQTDGKIDVIVMGLGTSGTFDGLSRYFKSREKEVKVIAFEPASSPVYSGGAQGKHRLIGIGPGFVTENFKRSRQNMDELILVPDEAGFEMTRMIAREEGLLVGPTSGAAAWVCRELVKRPDYKNKTLVCLFYDTGERYLSTKGLFQTDNVVFEP